MLRIQTGRKFRAALVPPAIGMLIFLMLWQGAAGPLPASSGGFPGPADVWRKSVELMEEHRTEQHRKAAFYEGQRERMAIRQQQNPGYSGELPGYAGRPTFLDQAGTSLVTVLAGFGLAALLAVPLGILVGLSANLHRALNPLIQLFKPISPLAWLPLVTVMVSGVASPDALLTESFMTSTITVLLCCLWPMVINTAIGVASVEPDWLNVSRVLRLNTLTHLRKIVLPAAVPAIFTGLRLSLGIAWMVLIAAEMLAQSPGLGKFIWDEFQSGSAQSLERIMAAVIAIGIIGLVLDQLMLAGQRAVSWDPNAAIR